MAGELSGTATSPTITNSAVIGKVLTGYASAAGTVAATDNILEAIQKLNGNLDLKVPYTGATSAVNLGAYDLTVNGLTIGRGRGAISTNTATGLNSLFSNTTGSQNTANGAGSLYSNTTGSQNTAYGFTAGKNIVGGSSNTTSDYSIYIGSNTSASADDAQNEVVIGYNASGAGSNTIQLGNTAVTLVKTSGTVNANGTTLTSDLRIKSNIVPLANSLATVMQLNPVHYMKKGSLASTAYTREENGFIAQEIQKILPFVVTEGTDENKLLSVDYNSFIPVLTKAIQEQQKQIEDQNAKIAAQQKQIEELIKLVKGR